MVPDPRASDHPMLACSDGIRNAADLYSQFWSCRSTGLPCTLPDRLTHCHARSDRSTLELGKHAYFLTDLRVYMALHTLADDTHARQPDHIDHASADSHHWHRPR